MNLADYEKMDTSSGPQNYIKFEKTGDTKYLRFLYESGGDEMGKDVEFRRKYWDEENKKFVYDGPEGQLVCALKCIQYDADGKNPKLVRWERSAYFCKNVLLPMWRNYPRIIDGVWKVTATNPKTIDATYSLFPVMNADMISFPLIREEDQPKEEKKEQPKKTEEAKNPVQATRKKYWE